METAHVSDDEAAALATTVGVPSHAGQRVVWNKAKGEFDLQPIWCDLGGQKASSAAPSTYKSAVTAESLDTALSKFEVDQFRYESSFLDFQSTRSQLTQKILSSGSPVKHLPKFLSKWSALLDFFNQRTTKISNQYGTSLCDELLEIAQSFKSMGDIEEARAHLGKCITLARRHGHTSQEEPASNAAIVFEKAKKALFECIKSQESLANCQRLLLRSKNPPQVLAYLVREVGVLSSQAPFSIEILRIKTNLLWKTGQYAAIVNCLTALPSLTEMDAHLTFTYARALESLGLYEQSLNAVAKWKANEDSSTPAQRLPAGSEDTVVAALHSHKQRLYFLLEWKSKAEQLQRDEKYQDAARCYSKCVDLLTKSCNNSFKASLLFNHANMALMMMPSAAPAATEATHLLSSAIGDLTLSLKLNPSNQLAKLRLDTAVLQLETEKLKSRIK